MMIFNKQVTNPTHKREFTNTPIMILVFGAKKLFVSLRGNMIGVEVTPVLVEIPILYSLTMAKIPTKIIFPLFVLFFPTGSTLCH